MINDDLKLAIIEQICNLLRRNFQVVLVHGGGPFIRDIFKMANIESEFIDGHRKTTPSSLKYVEMALKGRVNGMLVNLINSRGYKAVGLSGKDGKMVKARKRIREKVKDGRKKKLDLGLVGDVSEVDTHLIETLLLHNYMPVIASLAAGYDGTDFNINADMFAGALAGALQVDDFLILTDIDGLMTDVKNPESLISEINASRIRELMLENIIAGGMIPKIEAGLQAIQQGVQRVRIINGMKPGQINFALNGQKAGTLITR